MDNLMNIELDESSSTLSIMDKMTMWHNGTRGFNYKAAGDEKLKAAYEACVSKGFGTEAKILKIEGMARGLKWAQSVQNATPKPKVFPIIQANDIHYADYAFVRDNQPNDVIKNCDNAHMGEKPYIISLIFAIIAQLHNSTEILKNEILTRGDYTKDELKSIIQTTMQDKEVVKRLNDILAVKENLQEDIEKHNVLNPKLWNEDNTLKQEVIDKINDIVIEFTKGLDDKEIKYKLDDIKLVGSNCSYNYNKNSDLDVHLVFDLSIYDDTEKQEMAEIIYDYARGNWNKNHDIYFYDIPVEIFVETNNTEQLN